MHCILTFCDLLAPALAGLRVAEEDVGGGAVVVVVTRAIETGDVIQLLIGRFEN